MICEPEIFSYKLNEEDRFLVIASDGVWEFLDNKAVVNMVIPYFLRNEPEKACEKLIKEATNYWKKEDDIVDDITAIVIFLKNSNT